jgi:mRNA-degrading endonuclease toxin of MazEF toxin-antitoxin module
VWEGAQAKRRPAVVVSNLLRAINEIVGAEE